MMEQGQWTWAGEEGYRWLRAAGGTRRHGVAVAVADGGAGTVEGLSRRGQRIVATAATKWSTSASTLSTARLGLEKYGRTPTAVTSVGVWLQLFRGWAARCGERHSESDHPCNHGKGGA